MKISVLIIALLVVNTAVAQKSKVNDAINYYNEPLQQYDKAKDAIDEAVQNEQTKTSDKAWYYRGRIYQTMYKDPKYGNLCSRCLETAYESFTKAMELNPKNEWAVEIQSLRLPFLMRDFFDRGVKEFNNKDYKGALESFEMVQKINPTDTSVIINSAYAADKANDFPKAKIYYNRLIIMGVKDNTLYIALANIYKQEKDTVRELLTIQDGRKLFPDSMNLMLAEINLLLATGKNKEASQSLDAAVKRDPNNQSLYLAMGSTFDNLANPKDAVGNDLPRPLNYSEYMTKAEQAYLRGLQINPNNYEMNFNLGAMYFNLAAEMANTANTIKSTDEYNKAKEKFDQKFRDAQPYLEKAIEQNPKKTPEDQDIYDRTVTSLKQLYVRTNQMDKYNALKEKK